MFNKENRLVKLKGNKNVLSSKERFLVNENAFSEFFSNLFYNWPKKGIEKVSDAVHPYPKHPKIDDNTRDNNILALKQANPSQYYATIMHIYDQRLNRKNNEMEPFERKLEELEAKEKEIEEIRLDRIQMRDELEPKLENLRTFRSYHSQRPKSITTMRLDKEIAALERKIGEREDLPDLNPELTQDNAHPVLKGASKIRLKMYQRLLRSKIAVLKRKADYYETNRDRAEYWEKRKIEESLTSTK